MVDEATLRRAVNDAFARSREFSGMADRTVPIEEQLMGLGIDPVAIADVLGERLESGGVASAGDAAFVQGFIEGLLTGRALRE